MMFVHRQLPDGDLYFIVNRSKTAKSLEARFRVTGKAPEILRAEDGSAAPASYRQEGGVTAVPPAGVLSSSETAEGGRATAPTPEVPRDTRLRPFPLASVVRLDSPG